MTELQKLEQQVAELQATIGRMKEPEPIKQWEPQGGEYKCYGDGSVDKTQKTKNDFGATYKTKEQAEWARDHMRRFNRLLAYVAENSITPSTRYFIDEYPTVKMDKQCFDSLTKGLKDNTVVL